jgi:hypothetical protein
MSFLFKAKPKVPHELVKATEELVVKLDHGDPKKVAYLLMSRPTRKSQKILPR